MRDLQSFTVVGIVTGSIYAIAASGLVVTYTTSGVFNFAHGAIAMIAAFLYWQVKVDWGWGTWPALLVVLGVFAPLFGILIEQYTGAFPLWLAPVQAAVLPITDRANAYAERVAASLREAGLRAEANARGDKIGAKIRNAQLQKIPFMLVVGDREMEEGTVAVRERSRGDLGVMSLGDFIDTARRLVSTRALTNE